MIKLCLLLGAWSTGHERLNQCAFIVTIIITVVTGFEETSPGQQVQHKNVPPVPERPHANYSSVHYDCDRVSQDGDYLCIT